MPVEILPQRALSRPNIRMSPGRDTPELQPTSVEISVSDSLDVEGWDDFVAQHENGHHVQVTAWARFQGLRGWRAIRIVARLGSSPVAVAQILTKGVRAFGRLGYLDRAPLVDPGHPEVLPLMVAAIETVARERAIRVLVSQPSSERVAAALVEAGSSSTDIVITLPATVRVDLTPEIDEILAKMKSKTRYNVRKGLRSGLAVREGDRTDVGFFHEMLEATAQRQDFESNTVDFIEGLLDTLGSEGHCAMFIAEDEEGPISAILLVAFGGVVVYKRGAWSGRGGNLHPNELLHWKAMQWAKESGYRQYDFDGIEPEVGRLVLAGHAIPPVAALSVTRFRLGFGGDVVLYPSALSYIPNRLLRFGHNRIFRPLSGTKIAKRGVKWLQTR
jgi:peptidoglycan pentaglycine glycine transferase (the first glycine)